MKKNNALTVVEKLADILMEEANAEITQLRNELDEARKDLALEQYKNKILSEIVDEQDVIITNLRKDLDGMVREKNNA